MLKKLACALALVIPTTAAADRVYDVKPVRAIYAENDYPCGAVSRMLRDKHIIKISDDGTVTVNGFKWTVVRDEPNLVLEFHAENRSVVYLEMNLYVNMRGLSGAYYLYGVVDSSKRDREKCFDAVFLDGTVR